MAAAKSVQILGYGDLAVQTRAGSLTRSYDAKPLHRLLALAQGYENYEVPRAGSYYGYVGAEQGGKRVLFSLPFFERYVRISIQENVDPVPNQFVKSQEGNWMAVGTAVTWRIMGHGDNPYKSLLRLNDPYNANNHKELRQKVVKISGQAVSAVMQKKPEEEMYEFETLTGEIIDQSTAKLGSYGVEMVGVDFENPYETSWSRQARAIESLSQVLRDVSLNEGAAAAVAIATQMNEDNPDLSSGFAA